MLTLSKNDVNNSTIGGITIEMRLYLLLKYPPLSFRPCREKMIIKMMTVHNTRPPPQQQQPFLTFLRISSDFPTPLLK